MYLSNGAPLPAHPSPPSAAGPSSRQPDRSEDPSRSQEMGYKQSLLLHPTSPNRSPPPFVRGRGEFASKRSSLPNPSPLIYSNGPMDDYGPPHMMRDLPPGPNDHPLSYSFERDPINGRPGPVHSLNRDVHSRRPPDPWTGAKQRYPTYPPRAGSPPRFGLPLRPRSPRLLPYVRPEPAPPHPFESREDLSRTPSLRTDSWSTATSFQQEPDHRARGSSPELRPRSPQRRWQTPPPIWPSKKRRRSPSPQSTLRSPIGPLQPDDDSQDNDQLRVTIERKDSSSSVSPVLSPVARPGSPMSMSPVVTPTQKPPSHAPSPPRAPRSHAARSQAIHLPVPNLELAQLNFSELPTDPVALVETLKNENRSSSVWTVLAAEYARAGMLENAEHIARTGVDGRYFSIQR